MTEFTATLPAEEDCYGVGGGCLIDKFALSSFEADCKAYVTGQQLPALGDYEKDTTAEEAWLDGFVGKTVAVTTEAKVFAGDEFLGIYYV